jgi:hypothetical protein
MSTLAKSVAFDDAMMWVSLADGRQLGVPLAFFPRLLRAAPDYTGMHWMRIFQYRVCWPARET